MKFRLSIVILVLINLISCNKNDDEPSDSPKPKLATYFENNNETWYFKTTYEGSYYDSIVFFSKRVRDTAVVFMGDTFPAVILDVEINYHHTEKPMQILAEQIFFYDPDLRLLGRYRENYFTSVDFKYLDYKYKNRIACQQSVILDKGIEKIGEKNYRVYTNSKGQKIIEGITINIEDCSLYPNTIEYYGGNNLVVARYSSDEVSYEWLEE